jgi:hypothetical protein
MHKALEEIGKIAIVPVIKADRLRTQGSLSSLKDRI